MPHKVEISDKTYDKLKEYCELNDLKIGQLADKFIYDSLMIELYGDVPFTTYRVKPQEPVEVLVVNGTVTKEGGFKQESVETKKTLSELMKEYHDPVSFKRNELTGEIFITHDTSQQAEDAGPTEEFIKEWGEIEKYHQDQEKVNKTLKEVGVPDKVVNKITRRRLK